MSNWDSYKLTDAMEAMRNGTKSLNERIASKDAEVVKLNKEIGVMRREVDARRGILEAMQKLQDLMPDNVTIKFVVPLE